MKELQYICNGFPAKRTITVKSISYKKKNARQYKLYKLGGDGSPITKQAVQCALSHDHSIDPQIYGHFSISPVQESYMLAKVDILLEQDNHDSQLSAAFDENIQRNTPQISIRPCSEIADDLIKKDKLSKAKTDAIKIRRNTFSSNRAQLVLMMIDRGIEYVCNHPDCEEREFLTVDHIYPLSRGGGDEIDNLQFLCKAHNSIKGDRVS